MSNLRGKIDASVKRNSTDLIKRLTQDDDNNNNTKQGHFIDC
jgi:hypothetical protein